jgi:hypothetical protein
MARLLVALVLLAGVAACGGEDPGALDQIAYEIRLAPLDDLLTQSLESRDGVAGRLRDLADELESLQPPAPAVEPNAQLVQVLRYLAEDVEERDMLAYADDWQRLQDVVYALRDRGYEPFDGPDNE